VGLSSEPFHLCPGAGDLMPTRKIIWHHVFYVGVRGRMAVGYTDFHETNVKGRTLSFVFGADELSDTSERTKRLEPKFLKTFQTF
jgi:hypothetical protein